MLLQSMTWKDSFAKLQHKKSFYLLTSKKSADTIAIISAHCESHLTSLASIRSLFLCVSQQKRKKIQWKEMVSFLWQLFLPFPGKKRKKHVLNTWVNLCCYFLFPRLSFKCFLLRTMNEKRNIRGLQSWDNFHVKISNERRSLSFNLAFDWRLFPWKETILVINRSRFW